MIGRPDISTVKHHLKGGTLIYTLFIGLIISMLLGAYVLLNFLQQKQLDRLHHQQLAHNNAQSGLEMALSQEVNWGQDQELILFDTEIDTARLKTETWGLMGLIHVEGIHGRMRDSFSVLAGGNLQGPYRFSLLLQESREPLTLVGRTRLEGPLYLPAAGLRRGFIGRRGFEGEKLYTGPLSSSRGKGVALLPNWLDSLAYQAQAWAYWPQQDRYELSSLKINQPWNGPAKTYEVLGGVILRGDVDLQGKVQIIASRSIRIETGAKLEHTLLMAPEIYIDQGVSGCFQALATEKLIVADSVELAYPSFLALAKMGTEAALLEIGAGAEVQGAVIYLGQAMGGSKSRGDFCRLLPGSQVVGIAHASHNLDVQGSVIGRVSTGNFLLQTPGATYRNHLLDAQISVKGLSQTYAGPLLFPMEAYRVIDWLP
ncbi:MAG: hypothetical protein AAFV07_00245, partial [Bacteroidota bacterium]